MIVRVTKRETAFELFDKGFSVEEVRKYIKIAYSTLKIYNSQWKKERAAIDEIESLKTLVESLKQENKQLSLDKEFLMEIVDQVK